MRKALALLLALSLPLLAQPMRFHWRMAWGWGDVVLVSVAMSTLVMGALLTNMVLLAASLAALGLTVLMIQARAPQWWRGVLAFALLLLAFYVLFG